MHSVYAHTMSKVIEKRIAGLVDRFFQVGMAVSTTDGRAQGIVAPTIRDPRQPEVPWILNRKLVVHELMLQSGHTNKRFNGRSRRIRVNGAIEQWCIDNIVYQDRIVFVADSRDKQIRIKARFAHHG